LRRVRSRASRGRFAGRDAVSSPLLRLVGAAASFTQRRPASGDSAAVHKALRARWSPSFRRSSQLVSSLFDRWASNFGRARPSGCDHAGRPLAYLAFASCRRAIARKAEFKSEEAQTTPADGLGLWAAQRDVPKGRSPGRPFVLRPRSARAVNQLIGCSDRHRRASEGRPQGRPFVAERELRPATLADPLPGNGRSRRGMGTPRGSANVTSLSRAGRSLCCGRRPPSRRPTAREAQASEADQHHRPG
jgi:hypothetical protein